MAAKERTPYVPGTPVPWPRRFKRNVALDIARVTNILAYLVSGIYLVAIVFRVVTDLSLIPGWVRDDPCNLFSSAMQTPFEWADFILDRMFNLFAGAMAFVTFKAVSLGLYMLTEADYNIHDPEEAQA